MPPSLLDRVKARAAKNHRSAAAELLVIVEEAFDQPDPTQVPAATSGSHKPPPVPPWRDDPRLQPRVGQAGTSIEQTILRKVLKDAVNEYGTPDEVVGRRVDKWLPQKLFYAARPEKTESTNRSGYYKAIKAMVDSGEAGRDDRYIWLL